MIADQSGELALEMAPASGTSGATQPLYASKSDAYFAGARADLVGLLPNNPTAAILEIGCGDGRTGELALAVGKCATYCGVELLDRAARHASERLTEVVVGDVQSVNLPWAPKTFDAVIMSEVLEHLVDPWAALRRLRPLLKSGAIVLASSPNSAHYKVILMLLRGEWKTEDSGPMDRTHLRWFTPRSYRRMFESCGFAVDRVSSVGPLGWKAKALTRLTFGAAFHLLTRQVNLRGHAA
jgi:2-polyprenyl-3-methyl-5-hydroxy-6-metoxy-1,4-benzoquinol methylase